MMDAQESNKSGISPVVVGGAVSSAAVGAGGLTANAMKETSEIRKLSKLKTALTRMISDAPKAQTELQPDLYTGKLSLDASAMEANLKAITERVDRYAANGAMRSAFANMSWKGKTALGVAAVGAGLETGHLINKWLHARNRIQGGGEPASPDVQRRYRETQQALGASDRGHVR